MTADESDSEAEVHPQDDETEDDSTSRGNVLDSMDRVTEEALSDPVVAERLSEGLSDAIGRAGLPPNFFANLTPGLPDSILGLNGKYAELFGGVAAPTWAESPALSEFIAREAPIIEPFLPDLDIQSTGEQMSEALAPVVDQLEQLSKVMQTVVGVQRDTLAQQITAHAAAEKQRQVDQAETAKRDAANERHQNRALAVAVIAILIALPSTFGTITGVASWISGLWTP